MTNDANPVYAVTKQASIKGAQYAIARLFTIGGSLFGHMQPDDHHFWPLTFTSKAKAFAHARALGGTVLPELYEQDYMGADVQALCPIEYGEIALTAKARLFLDAYEAQQKGQA